MCGKKKKIKFWGRISCFCFFFRLGEITLHDFKGSFDRPGQYRYHFKALDPEFGTVKEEVRLILLMRQ
jgi:hypothetical protein